MGFNVVSDRIVDLVAPEVMKTANREVNKQLVNFQKEIFFSNYDGTLQLRSQRGDTQIEIEFVNKLDEMVVVYWINYEGDEKEYFELQLGESKKQKTYVTHLWIVKKGKSKEPVGSIIGRVDDEQILIEASGDGSGN